MYPVSSLQPPSTLPSCLSPSFSLPPVPGFESFGEPPDSPLAPPSDMEDIIVRYLREAAETDNASTTTPLFVQSIEIPFFTGSMPQHQPSQQLELPEELSSEQPKRRRVVSPARFVQENFLTPPLAVEKQKDISTADSKVEQKKRKISAAAARKRETEAVKKSLRGKIARVDNYTKKRWQVHESIQEHFQNLNPEDIKETDRSDLVEQYIDACVVPITAPFHYAAQALVHYTKEMQGMLNLLAKIIVTTRSLKDVEKSQLCRKLSQSMEGYFKQRISKIVKSGFIDPLTYTYMLPQVLIPSFREMVTTDYSVTDKREHQPVTIQFKGAFKIYLAKLFGRAVGSLVAERHVEDAVAHVAIGNETFSESHGWEGGADLIKAAAEGYRNHSTSPQPYLFYSLIS